MYGTEAMIDVKLQLLYSDAPTRESAGGIAGRHDPPKSAVISADREILVLHIGRKEK